MSAARLLCFVLLILFASTATAGPDLGEWLARQRQARLSAGFSLRLAATPATATADAIPTRISVVGDGTAGRQRLSIRGLSPASIRDLVRTAESRKGCVRAIEAQAPIDPAASLFDTPINAWDLLAPWWDWPEQSLGAERHVGGHTCRIVRSRSPNAHSPAAEVRSCIDIATGVALRTELFDRQGHRLRVIEIQSTVRQESGQLAPHRLSISTSTESWNIEAYSGDEHYEIPPATFLPLQLHPNPCE